MKNTHAAVFTTAEIVQQMGEVRDVIARLTIRRTETKNKVVINDIDLALLDLKRDLDELTAALLSK